MSRERGSGVTPQPVVHLLQAKVREQSMLAVSEATGIGLAAIGRYMKGIGEPTTATLKKLSAYFGVSVPYLRGDGRAEDTPELATLAANYYNAYQHYMERALDAEAELEKYKAGVVMNGQIDGTVIHLHGRHSMGYGINVRVVVLPEGSGGHSNA